MADENLVLIGPQNSGKTFWLAALYRQLVMSSYYAVTNCPETVDIDEDRKIDIHTFIKSFDDMITVGKNNPNSVLGTQKMDVRYGIKGVTFIDMPGGAFKDLLLCFYYKALQKFSNVSCEKEIEKHKNALEEMQYLKIYNKIKNLLKQTQEDPDTYVHIVHFFDFDEIIHFFYSDLDPSNEIDVNRNSITVDLKEEFKENDEDLKNYEFVEKIGDRWILKDSDKKSLFSIEKRESTGGMEVKIEDKDILDSKCLNQLNYLWKYSLLLDHYENLHLSIIIPKWDKVIKNKEKYEFLPEQIIKLIQNRPNPEDPKNKHKESPGSVAKNLLWSAILGSNRRKVNYLECSAIGNQKPDFIPNLDQWKPWYILDAYKIVKCRVDGPCDFSEDMCKYYDKI